MAKAIKFYTGTDTYGNSVDMAQREDGVWFSRHEENTRYGVKYTKWYKSGDPNFDTHYINEYDGKRYKYDEPVMTWGFNTMEKLDYTGARLPND